MYAPEPASASASSQPQQLQGWGGAYNYKPALSSGKPPKSTSKATGEEGLAEESARYSNSNSLFMTARASAGSCRKLSMKASDTRATVAVPTSSPALLTSRRPVPLSVTP